VKSSSADDSLNSPSPWVQFTQILISPHPHTASHGHPERSPQSFTDMPMPPVHSRVGTASQSHISLTWPDWGQGFEGRTETELKSQTIL